MTDTLQWTVDGGHQPHLADRGGGGHASDNIPSIGKYPSLEEATEAAHRARQGKPPQTSSARGSGRNYFESAQGGGRAGVAASHEKDFAKSVVKGGTSCVAGYTQHTLYATHYTIYVTRYTLHY